MDEMDELLTNETMDAETIDETEQTLQEESKPEKSDVRTRWKERGHRLRTSMSDDDEAIDIQHMRDLMRNISLDGKWVQRHLGILLLIMVGIIIYITNGYQAQHEMIRESQLVDEVEDWHYRSMTVHSKLTTRSRQSQIESQLRAKEDTTLILSRESPYELK